MSAIPTPKPRALSQEKRPIPLPRTNIPRQDVIQEIEQSRVDVPPNTLTRRISNTSKQIREEISSVIDQTRLSLKKKHRKSVEEQQEVAKVVVQSPEIFNTIRFDSPLSLVVPDTNSYIEENEIYNKWGQVDENVSEDETDGLPPPKHPPPPLPDMSVYDTPQKTKENTILSPEKIPRMPKKPPKLPYIPPPPETDINQPSLRVLPPSEGSNSPLRQNELQNSSSEHRFSPIESQNSTPRQLSQQECRSPPITPRAVPPIPGKPPARPVPLINVNIDERTTYEAVFPVYPVFSQSTDSESSGESKAGTLDRMESTRPESWNFYDPVTLNDSTYMNVATYRRNR